MTFGSTFPRLLTKIDALTLADHFYLTEVDECYFLGEYTARKGFEFSATNQLIFNLKKSLSTRGQAQWRYKQAAIAQAAAAFSGALNTQWLNVATLVPMPPSKARNDPLYDDRMLQVLRLIRPSAPPDIRELIVQTQSTEAVHERDERPTPAQIQELYSCDVSGQHPPPRVIGIFDDVLTTGSHFKAAQQLLQSRFPQAKIVGFFVARRAPETADPSEFEVLV